MNLYVSVVLAIIACNVNAQDDDNDARCAFACPSIYQPVCATDSDGEKQTFGSECALRSAECFTPRGNFFLFILS